MSNFRWPWVSREAYDALLESRTRESMMLTFQNTELRSQLADMTARYHNLRLMGAVPAPEPAPAPPAPPDDPVLDAIAEECGDDYAKRAMMLRQVREDRAAHVSDEDIIHRIRHGVEPEGMPI